MKRRGDRRTETVYGYNITYEPRTNAQGSHRIATYDGSIRVIPDGITSAKSRRRSIADATVGQDGIESARIALVALGLVVEDDDGLLDQQQPTRLSQAANDRHLKSKEPVGTVQISDGGYAFVMTDDGTFKLQHREVMQQRLGRSLLPGESVHHRNGVRHDNRIENLELWASITPYRDQPSGQRVADLIAYVVKNHPERTRTALDDESENQRTLNGYHIDTVQLKGEAKCAETHSDT